MNPAVHHSSAEHAGTELLTAVGLPVGAALAAGVAPALLVDGQACD